MVGIRQKQPKNYGFRRGPSNTIMLIELPGTANVPWTKPLDVTPDEAVKLVRQIKDGDYLWVGMFDGGVTKIGSVKNKDFTDEQIKQLFVPNSEGTFGGFDAGVFRSIGLELLPGIDSRQ